METEEVKFPCTADDGSGRGKAEGRMMNVEVRCGKRKSEIGNDQAVPRCYIDQRSRTHDQMVSRCRGRTKTTPAVSGNFTDAWTELTESAKFDFLNPVHSVSNQTMNGINGPQRRQATKCRAVCGHEQRLAGFRVDEPGKRGGAHRQSGCSTA